MTKKTLYIKIMSNLIKGNRITQSFLELKKNFSYPEFQQCFKMMVKNNLYKKQLLSIVNIRSYSNLIEEGMFPMLLKKDEIVNIKTVAKEFEFTAAFLSSYSKILKEFNKLRIQFEQVLLCGKFKEAENLLDLIVKNYGKSFWYVETKLLLLHISGKDDLFHDFYEEVKSAMDHEILHTYIRIIQRKIKFGISNDEYKKFCKRHEKQLWEAYPEEHAMISYMMFMSFYFTDDVSQEEDYLLQNLIIILQHLPLIDQYLLFYRLDINLRIQLLEKQKHPYRKDLTVMLNALNNFRKDLDLFVCCIDQNKDLYDVNSFEEYIKKNINMEFETTIKSVFIDGDYANCIKYCWKVLNSNFNFPTVVLLVQAYIASDTNLENLSEKRILDFVVKQMCKMYVKNNNQLQFEMWQALPRIFMSCSFGTELLEFVYNQLYDSTEYITKKCIYISLYSQNKISAEHILLLQLERREEFLNAWKKIIGKFSICNWSENIKLLFKDYTNICFDQVTEQLSISSLKDMANLKLHVKQYKEHKNTLDMFFREEYGVLIFNKAIKCKDYKTAFSIYVNLFFVSPFSVIRMPVRKLNKCLNYGNCRLFYKNLDFIIYAYNTKLQYVRPDLPSEYVKNSFREILKVYGVNKPSLLKLPTDFLESWKMSYFLYYICDLKMLTILDLYGLNAIEERRKVLRIVCDKYDCDVELKNLDEQEIRINLTSRDTETMQMKAICANWIKIPDNELINTVMQKINNYRSNSLKLMHNFEISEYRIFREFIINCKGLYISAVNDKLGTTIRHCILERIMQENLINYKVYLNDNNDLQKILREIPLLSDYTESQQYEIIGYLSGFFDRFFLLMDRVRQNIYFTEHKDKDKVRFYIPDDILEEGTRRCLQVSNELELKNLVMKLLHQNLEEQILILGKYVVKQIQEGYTIEVQTLVKNLKKFPRMKAYLQILEDSVEHALEEIQQQFKVTYNENEEHMLNSYISMICNKFRYIKVINECSREIKMRNGIIWTLDIILKNVIQNVEKHAKISVEKADFKILIKQLNDTMIELTFQNMVSSDVNLKELKDTIDEINKNIREKAYIDMKVEDDGHGLGYYRIARLLYDLKEPHNLQLSLNENSFLTIVSFELGKKGEKNASVNC